MSHLPLSLINRLNQTESTLCLQRLVAMFPKDLISEYLGPVYENMLCVLYEPPRDKTNKVTCAPSEDSDQPGHPPSLIRVFAVRMKKAWVLSYPLSAQRRL